MGYSGSPCIYENLVIFNLGKAGVALNKNNCDVVWFNGPEKCGCATPVIVKQKTNTFVVIFSHMALVFLEVNTGKMLWSYEWEDDYDVFAADPHVIGDSLFFSTSNGKGCVLLNISGTNPKEIWLTQSLKNIYGGNIYFNGYLYGVDGDMEPKAKLKCIRLKTGKEMWCKDTGFGSLTAVQDNLLFLDEEGMLTIFQENAMDFQVLLKSNMSIEDVGYTPPILSNGKIYIRNSKGRLVCFKVR
jgi:outer membrane protein assembly factor BamB